MVVIGCVLSAVHHAEVIAHRIGQPFGTLVLALSITIIEVSLIISLMVMDGPDASSLARDTVFAAVMIILNGMIGLSILVGSIKFKEQSFGLRGISSALTILVVISVLTLILPNYTVSIPGPFYTNKQLFFVAITTIVLYLTFLLVQNFRHKDHFLDVDETEKIVEVKPSMKQVRMSMLMLCVCLVGVVFLAESLSPGLHYFVESIGAPISLVGVIIACVILLPEGISAFKAAQKNQLQKSLNLSIGSALASVGLTIPVVALVSIYTGMPLSLGIDAKSTLLFILSLFVINLSLSTGKTTIIQGMVLLIIFSVYLFTTIVP
jgi:Ca2+:H+ antiporter